MLPGATRGISLWYVLLVKASAGRLVLASTARRVTPPAFVRVTSVSSGTSRSGSSRSSSSISSSSISLGAKGALPPPRAGQCSSPFLPSSWKAQRSPLESSQRFHLSSPPQQQPPQMYARRGLAQSMSSPAAVGLGETPRSSSATVGSSPATGSSSSSSSSSRSVGSGNEEEELTLDAARGGGGGGGIDHDGDGVMRVTLLSGFLGAGKTTLMRNVLRQARQERLPIAVIVNDMADVNIDVQLLTLGEDQIRPEAREGKAGGLLGTDIRSVGSEEEQQRSSGGGGGGVAVAMQGGCICCTLLDDLLLEVEAIARDGKCRHLIIESTGISDPTPVAQALATSPSSSSGSSSSSSSSSSEGGGLSAEGEVSDGDTGDVGREEEKEEGVMVEIAGTGTGTAAGGGGGGGGVYAVDTLVTVVDSTSFLDEVRKADDLEERGLEAGEGDTRTVADLLVSQVEFANVILLNKADLASEDDMATLETLIRRLNPAARVTRTVSSDVGLDDVLGTGDFDFEEASQAAGWLQALNDDAERAAAHRREHEQGEEYGHAGGNLDSGAPRRRGKAYGIGSFTFHARKPFHPDRLMGFVMAHLPSVLRSKGFLWLATRHDTAGVWNQAGGSFATEFGGSWDDDEPDRQDAGGLEATAAAAKASARVHASSDANADASANAYADADTRRNELVFIGIGMDESSLTSELRRCLLTEEEMAAGPAGWARMSDPFPPWLADDGTYGDM